MSARPRESVWDYPRPPRVEACDRRARVEHASRQIAESERALRVLETASPPTIYLPADDVSTGLLSEVPGEHTYCEWKGRAHYLRLDLDPAPGDAVAWYYPQPREAFAVLRGHIAFYAGRVDACWLGEERVRPQGGSFYGGWVTDEIEGPYKGEPGTEGW